MFQCNCGSVVQNNYRVEIAFSTVHTKGIVKHYVCLACSFRVIALTSPYARMVEEEKPRENITTFKRKDTKL